MMTKLSGFLAAFFTAPVFIVAFIKKWREKHLKGIIGQFAAFGGVCVPLGLWYPIRNLILFGQPLGYVLKFPDSSWLYCGDKSLFSRFLFFPLDHVINPLYCSSGDDYNTWLYVLKSSLFGEYSFDRNSAIAAALIILNLLMILISVAAMIYVIVRRREINRFARFGLFWVWFVQMASFFAFNLEYAFGCTMDFRYIMSTAIVGAVYIGIALDYIKSKHKPATNRVYIAGCVAIALFSIASVLFYAV
jgi:hypothetical protein